MKKFRLIMMVIVGILCLTALTYADVPRVLNYQGKFTDNDNNPLSGNYLITFRFYENESAGEVIWEEGHILALNSGVFNALLHVSYLGLKVVSVCFTKRGCHMDSGYSYRACRFSSSVQNTFSHLGFLRFYCFLISCEYVLKVSDVINEDTDSEPGHFS